MLALITPSVLSWARQHSGLDLETVAKKLRTPTATILAWENGLEKLSFAQLEKVSLAYRRPTAFFFLPKPPPEPNQPKDFRKNAKHKGGLSPEILLAIRKARSLQEIYEELAEEEHPSRIGLPRIDAGDNPATVANGLHEHLGIATRQQLQTRTESDYLNLLRDRSEEQGLYVSQSPMPVDEIRAFSLWSGDKPPVIVLNSKDAPSARVFSLIHELTHIMLRDAGMCDFGLIENGNSGIEAFCNKVAANFLLPEEVFRQATEGTANTVENWSDNDYRLFAHKFKVSRDVVARRQLDLHYIDKPAYNELLERWSQVAQPNKKGGFSTPEQQALSRVGKKFTSMLLDRMAKEKISMASVSRYLGIKAKRIQKIQNKLLDHGAL